VTTPIYDLIDVEERHLAHPMSFPIPPIMQRATHMPGDQAKIVVFPGERMWVEVLPSTEIHPEGYTGKLLNHPQIATRLKWGDEIEFRPEHVADIKRRSPT
jgi:hypothetical protein